MNIIDRVILEWSYKTKKGYPDINSQEDMALFESIFGFIPLLNEDKDLVNLIKSKINRYGDISATAGTSKIVLKFSEIPSRGASSSTLRGEVFTELEKLANQEEDITSYTKARSSSSSVGQSLLTFRGNDYSIIVKGTAAEDSADTDVKEGLVSLFYVSDITSPFTVENISERAERLISTMPTEIPGEDSTSTEKIVSYLSALEPKNSHVNFVNQPLSSALAIKEKYPKAKLIRSGKFNEIRSKAKQLTGYDKDKWCPGDLYVQLKGIPDINSADNIEIINNFFVQEWGGTTNVAGEEASLVAVSLKQQKAQGGKAKGLLAKYSKVKSDYNLTNDEKEYDVDQFKEAIVPLRSKISSLVGSADNVSYNLESISLEGFDIDQLRGKYAALKAIEFLFKNFPPGKIADAVVALAGFAMSLTDVNPGFFKIIGNSSGTNATVESYPQGTNIVLYNKEGDYKDIKIVDTDSYGGVRILFHILKRGKPHFVQISARNNGNTQGTLEIEKIDPI